MLPHYLGGTTDAYAFLDRIGIRNQLVHVRMPSIRTRAQERRLVTTLAAMPRLQDLDIVRNYRDLPYVEVPEGVRMAPPWPWLPADLQANYRVRVRATADRVAPGIAVDASVIGLETVLDELDPAIAATWTRILDWTSSLVIERASLAAALDAIDADIMPSWIPVRTALSAFAADVERVFVDVWDLI
jgi:hypothetical protein